MLKKLSAFLTRLDDRAPFGLVMGDR